jgi:Tfp pilus assembly protein PilE
VTIVVIGILASISVVGFGSLIDKARQDAVNAAAAAFDSEYRALLALETGDLASADLEAVAGLAAQDMPIAAVSDDQSNTVSFDQGGKQACLLLTRDPVVRSQIGVGACGTQGGGGGTPGDGGGQDDETPVVSSPSGEAMPTGNLPGWTNVFTDDFTSDVSLGSFPAAVSNKWTAYPSPWKDTSKNGTYSPTKVVSVSDGLLTKDLHTENGVPLVAAISPKLPGNTTSQLYGRYAVRFRAEQVDGYKVAWLLWPQSEIWPGDGEIDFPEMNLTSPNVTGAVHRRGAVSGSDQYTIAEPMDVTEWHTAVIEWSPNLVELYLDGEKVGRTTTRIPNTPMRWVLQTETHVTGGPPPADARGNVDIDWVSVWAYNAATAPPAAEPDPAPDHDEIVNPVVIPASATFPNSFDTGVIDLQYAGKEAGEAGIGNRTVWYRYTPTTNVTARFTATQTDAVGTVVYVRDGGTVSSPWVATCTNPTGSSTCTTTVALNGGTTYWVQFGALLSSGQARMQLQMTAGIAPANDNIAAATVIPASANYPNTFNTGNVDLGYATKETGEVGIGNRTAWYRYTPVDDVTATFTVSQADSSGVVVYARTGGTVSSPFVITCTNATSSCTATGQLTAGTDYWIHLGAISSTGPATVQMQMSTTAVPVNDNSANATVIPASATFPNTFDTGDIDLEFATKETGEAGIGNRTVWYQYTPTSNVTARFTISQTNPVGIVIYVRTSASTTAFVGTCTNATSSCITAVPMTANTSYWVQFGTTSSTGTAPVRLEMTAGPTPVNDDSANATVIPASATFPNTFDTGMVDINYATRVTGEPGIGNRTVWYRYTPTSTVNATFSVSQTGSNGANVYIRTSASTTSFVGTCTHASSNCSTTVSLAAGTTYWIQFGTTTSSGSAPVRLQMSAVLAP